MQAALDKLVKAIGDFYARESHLLDRDLGELTLTLRLSLAVERQFQDW